MPSNKVSAIVPVYNEEDGVVAVLGTLASSPLLDEIIVDDDGSTDGSLKKAEEFKSKASKRVSIVSHPKNRGKADALLTGAKAARNSILFFCDADLTNFTTGHIKELIEPFLKSEADLVTGVQEYLAFWENFSWYPKRLKKGKKSEFMSALGGEKVIAKSDFLALEERIKSSGYGLEQVIHSEFRRKGKRVKLVALKGVGHEWKVTKWGWEGVWRETKALFTFAKQYIRYFLNPKGWN